VTRFKGVGSAVTAAKISVAELETLVKCSVVLDVLPLEVADDILSAFVDEAKRLRQGKGQFIYDKQIAHERLSTGFNVPDTLAPAWCVVLFCFSVDFAYGSVGARW